MSVARLIPGHGPEKARLCFIGEAPGPVEHKVGRPFAGKSGEVLRANCLAAGLDWSEAFITNLYPFWPGPGNPDPTPKQIREFEHILIRDLAKHRPSSILLIGRIAGRWLLGNVSIEVNHGIPHIPTERWRELGLPLPVPVCVLAAHPAAGLRDPGMSAVCAEDIRTFAQVVRGEIPATTPTDTVKPDYQEIENPWFGGTFPLAVDTEGTVKAPWGMSWSPARSPSNKPLHGAVALARYPAMVIDTDIPNPVVLHNSLWDLGVLRRMKVRLDGPLVDTMVMAYLLRTEPLGLKDLALRHCGMQMREFNDVVRPHARKAAREYLERAAQLDLPKAEEQVVRDPKTRRMRIKRPHGISTRIRSLLTSFDKPSVNPWERWSQITPSLRAPVEAALGPFPEFSLFSVPQDEAVQYAARDADATLRVYHALLPRIRAGGLEGVLRLDMDSLPMFERMQSNGIAADRGHLDHLHTSMEGPLLELEREWCKEFNSGRSMNLRSNQQMGEYLYKRLAYPVLKKTETGQPAVDEKTLELLYKHRPHPSIPKLKKFKKQATLLSFVDRLPRFIQEDGRIRARINLCKAVTGRPACSEPNLLNIPVRDEQSKEIRNAFIAPPGKLLCSTDLSQIELRIMAHLSGDERMVRAYHTGEDIHDITARGLGVSRALGKKANFLIQYGGGARRLDLELKVAGIEGYDEQACEEVIEGWYALYPGVQAFKEERCAEGRRFGFVRGMSGRIRPLPHLRLGAGDPAREEAERFALNFPIQEGAAYIIKRAMKRIWDWTLANLDLSVEWLLQIYDELLAEMPEGSEWLAPVLRSMMIADARELSLRVPLEASVSFGYRWGDLK